jgi:secreted trypsin-like serine protease
MPHAMRRLAGCIVAPILVLTFAACASEPAVRSDDAEIQGGRRENGHPAVGVVRLATSRSFCSATLIAPDVVLTAAHCAEADERIDAFFTGTGRATADDSADPGSLGMARREVAEQALYPAYDYFYSCPNSVPDVALVRLKAPITDIAPAKLGRGGPLAAGASCRAVGFGAHDAGGGTTTFLEKRSASVVVSEVRGATFDVKAGTGITEHGDSGGPLFCDGLLVGTTSCLPDYPPDAVSYVALTAARSWILAMLERWDPQAAAAVDAGAPPP